MSENRQLLLTGLSRAAMKSDSESQSILKVFKDGKPRSTNAIVSECKINRNKAWELVKGLQAKGQLEELGKGSNGHPLWLPAATMEKG